MQMYDVNLFYRCLILFFFFLHVGKWRVLSRILEDVWRSPIAIVRAGHIH